MKYTRICTSKTRDQTSEQQPTLDRDLATLVPRLHVFDLTPDVSFFKTRAGLFPHNWLC